MSYEYPFANASDSLKRAVWEKARVVGGVNSRQYRLDVCGHSIRWDDHGRQTEMGWEIDHIVPRAKGGTDLLSNLQPLYWETNRSKGDGYPWACPKKRSSSSTK